MQSNLGPWLEYVTSGRVDESDCTEILEELDKEANARYNGPEHPRPNDTVKIQNIQHLKTNKKLTPYISRSHQPLCPTDLVHLN